MHFTSIGLSHCNVISIVMMLQTEPETRTLFKSRSTHDHNTLITTATRDSTTTSNTITKSKMFRSKSTTNILHSSSNTGSSSNTNNRAPTPTTHATHVKSPLWINIVGNNSNSYNNFPSHIDAGNNDTTQESVKTFST